MIYDNDDDMTDIWLSFDVPQLCHNMPPRFHDSFGFVTAVSLRHRTIVVPPAVIHDTTSEGIWSGMLAKHPVLVTGKVLGK